MAIEKPCPKCAGVGKIPCPSCGGTGHGSAFSNDPFCFSCRGNTRQTCNNCNGRGKVRDYAAERRAAQSQKESSQGTANVDGNGCLVVTIALLSPFLAGGIYWIS